MSNPSCWHLSASSISSYKACPTRFRLAYREGLRKIEDTDSQRMGTNWHKMHEVYAAALAELESEIEPGPTGEYETSALHSVIAHLNERYSVAPPNKTALEWAVEREILYRSFVAYLWYYQNDPITVLATEVPFKLPVKSPRVGMNLPTDEVVRVGKIDQVILWQRAVCALERKSTSKSLDAESEFWDRSQKDSQVSQYALAFRDMLPYANDLTAGIYGAFFELPLSQGKVAIVDEADRELVEGYKWHALQAESEGWYAGSKVSGKEVYLHRLLMECEPGDGRIIDHKNRDGLDCRRCNLRDTDWSGNQQNVEARGTAFHPAKNKWQARIHRDGRRLSLGYFDTEEDAAQAYKTAKAENLGFESFRTGNTLYDVWRKATIKPAMLTQKETAEFLASHAGVYCGQVFEIAYPTSPDALDYRVNGVLVDVEQGKKGFAIRETVEMYGARLLNDIYERPEHYFVRREISRSERDLVAFERQLFAIYQSQKLAEKYNAWVENEQQCRATFRCPYIPICYGSGADAVCDGKTEVPNFRRIFTDLTIEGEEV